MKGLLVSFVVAAGLALVLVGCGGDSDPPAAPPAGQQGASNGASAPASSGASAPAATPGQLRVTVDGQTFTAAALDDSCTVTGDTFFVFARTGDITISLQGSEAGGNVTISRGGEQIYTTPGTDADVQISGKSVRYTAPFSKGTASAGNGTANATCR